MSRKSDWEHFSQKFEPEMWNEEELRQYNWSNPDDWEVIVENSKKNLVWTCVDAEGKLYFSPGIRYINRLFYVLCNKPYTSEAMVRDYKW